MIWGLFKRTRAAVFQHMTTIPKGYKQSEWRMVYEIERDQSRKFFFLRFVLASMARRGEITKGRENSIWKSMNGLPTYGPLPEISE